MNFGSISNLNLILGSDGGNELDEWLPIEHKGFNVWFSDLENL